MEFFLNEIKDRENYIVQYIDETSISDEKSLSLFTLARINIMKSLLGKNLFPYAAYGYPVEMGFSFIADPSWEEYHRKPGE